MDRPRSELGPALNGKGTSGKPRVLPLSLGSGRKLCMPSRGVPILRLAPVGERVRAIRVARKADGLEGGNSCEFHTSSDSSLTQF